MLHEIVRSADSGFRLLKLYAKFLPNTRPPGASLDTPHPDDTQQETRPTKPIPEA